MPLAPATGDQGQRYMIEAEGYPSDGWCKVSFTDNWTNAAHMASSIGLAPGCKATRITDRKPDKRKIG